MTVFFTDFLSNAMDDIVHHIAFASPTQVRLEDWSFQGVFRMVWLDKKR